MSIKQLAAYLGLSKSTVSRALNGYPDVNPDTRQKVIKAAHEIGYRANPTAQRLASGKSRNVGIILPANSAMFVSPAFSKVLAAASTFLAKYQYKLIVMTLSDWQDEQDVYFDFITGGLIDGLFIVRLRTDDSRLSMLSNNNFPFVCFGHVKGYDVDSFVDVDNEDAFYQLTKRQIALGHRRIAFLDAPIDLTLSQARIRGYQAAMQEANLTVEPCWVLNGELTKTGATTMTKDVMSLAVPPTSILCADDIMAMGCIAACESLGYVPGVDVAVAGYGNYEYSVYSKPSITTLKYDTEAVGEMMAKLMLNKLDNQQFQIQNWYHADIVPRQSDVNIMDLVKN